ncbi:MAG: Fe-S cluster assembly ATPase SufC [Armatimonadetes bacterium]|nr:Fe-S cluster assembly ATPase SufC [Armatimonadota bacterium]
MSEVLRIRDLRVSVEGKEILKGLDLEVRQDRVHAIMGPNGSGKSTLANTLMGHPKYEVTGGEVLFRGRNVLDLSPDERARLGIFLAFQYPSEIPGVSVADFLRRAYSAVKGEEVSVMRFFRILQEKMRRLQMPIAMAERYLNEGFSGGEKKRNEVLQMAILEPQIAILDETDSGLDIDALRIVSEGVNALRGPDLGVLIITHYQRILRYIQPDTVSVLKDGRIVETGGRELAEKLEEHGYDWIREAA